MDTNNSFLVRERTKESGKLVLSVKDCGMFYHFPIERGVGSYQVEGTCEPFASIVELVDHYKQNGLPESESGKVILLGSPCVCDVSPVDSKYYSRYSQNEKCLLIAAYIIIGSDTIM